jgi:GxxExxY protein
LFSRGLRGSRFLFVLIAAAQPRNGEGQTARHANHGKDFLGVVFACFAYFAVSLLSNLMNADVLFKQESYQIVGACFEVYREKGCGFLESVYQECLEIELRLQGIPFVAQKPLALEYKGCPLRSKYEPDFICHDKIVVELKAVTEVTDEHRAQVQNYLKASSLKLGLLVNFGHYPKAQVERIVAERGRYAHDR